MGGGLALRSRRATPCRDRGTARSGPLGFDRVWARLVGGPGLLGASIGFGRAPRPPVAARGGSPALRSFSAFVGARGPSPGGTAGGDGLGVGRSSCAVGLRIGRGQAEGRRTRESTSRRSSKRKGLLEKPFILASAHLIRSSAEALAVRATMGRFGPSARRICRVASNPSIKGICMSMRMRSQPMGARSTASFPFSASSTSCPARSRSRRMRVWFTRLSSATRIRRRLDVGSPSRAPS